MSNQRIPDHKLRGRLTLSALLRDHRFSQEEYAAVDESPLLRVDRVGLYSLTDAWAILPWLTATYGDLILTDDLHELALTDDLRIHFEPVRGTGWSVRLADVSGVTDVSFATSLRCSSFNIRKQLLEATLGANGRFVVEFTGITKFTGTADRLLSHVPHVGH